MADKVLAPQQRPKPTVTVPGIVAPTNPEIEKSTFQSCVANVNREENTARVSFTIPADILRRLDNRRQTRPLAEYVWNEIVRPAMETHVY